MLWRYPLYLLWYCSDLNNQLHWNKSNATVSVTDVLFQQFGCMTYLSFHLIFLQFAHPLSSKHTFTHTHNLDTLKKAALNCLTFIQLLLPIGVGERSCTAVHQGSFEIKCFNGKCLLQRGSFTAVKGGIASVIKSYSGCIDRHRLRAYYTPML